MQSASHAGHVELANVSGAHALHEPPPLGSPQTIACGNTHSLFICDGAKANGEVWGWGTDRHGALGLAPAKKAESPEVHPPSREVFHVQQRQRSEADGDRQLEPLSMDAFEVSCGSNFSLVLERLESFDGLLTESKVWSFGINSNGQLGYRADASLGTGSSAHTERTLPPREVMMPRLVRHKIVVQRISCGSDHALAIVNMMVAKGKSVEYSGRVFAWGLGAYGALGTNSLMDESEPKEVWFPEDVKGSGSDSDRVTVIKQVAAGAKHSIACGVDGTVYTWGHGGNGRLGLGRSIIRDAFSYSAESEPRILQQLRDHKVSVKYIAAGEAHTAAIDHRGGVYTWGAGSCGRLGHGTALDSHSPTIVESLAGIAISIISLGLMHSVCATVKGHLYAWGKGPATGLGGLDMDVSATAKQVCLEDPRDPVQQIAAGPLHTVVLTQKGRLYCFGSGTEGRLPWRIEGMPKSQTYPKMIQTLGSLDKRQHSHHGVEDACHHHGVSEDLVSGSPPSLVCGGSNSALIASLGAGQQQSLWFWGSSRLAGAADVRSDAPVGQGLDAHCWTPMPLNKAFNGQAVRMVAIGMEHCLALTVDGKMFSWGKGDQGQLGTGSTQESTSPCQLMHPIDVLHVTAGEEHSGCVIGGGECFTWGNAGGGRLGLGNCLNDGVQLVSKRVAMEAVLIRSIAAGSQHTACISEDGRLLTFGMGWFGRLGSGCTNNNNVPVVVKMPGVTVKDVYCAMFHTCIVDSNNYLWVCGRDTSICRDGLDHQLSPALFLPFQSGTIRCIQALATCEQHTLAVTYIQGDPTKTELFAWGRNDQGQLGVSPDAAPRINMPWQLRIPELEALASGPKKRTCRLATVATAPGHSMCSVLVDRTNSNPRAAGRRSSTEVRKEGALDPIVFAWGLQVDGRLGVAHFKEVKEKLEALKQDLPPEQRKHLILMEQEVPINGQIRILPPMRVAWPSKPVSAQQENDSDSCDSAENSQSRDSSAGNDLGIENSVGEPSQTWLDVQMKLRSEDAPHKPDNLEIKFQDIKQKIKKFLDDIRQQWDKPLPGSISEYSLREKEGEVETEYIRLLKVLGLGSSMKAPKLPPQTKTDSYLLQRLHYVEELVWVLQQQPYYMSKLSTIFLDNTRELEEVLLFLRICGELWGQLQIPRVRNIFKALLRMVITEEVRRIPSMPAGQHIFDPRRFRSCTSSLMSLMVTNISCADSVALAMKVLDPKDPKSLASIIIRYTVCSDQGSKDELKPRTVRSMDRQAHKKLGGFLSFSYEEYKALHIHDAATSKDKEATQGTLADHDRALRHQYEEDIVVFKRMCQEDRRDGGSRMQGALWSFLQRFVKHILKEKEAEHVKMMLGFAQDQIEKQAFDGMFKDSESISSHSFSPIAALVIGSILAGILKAVDTAPYSLVRTNIKNYVQKFEDEVLQTWNQRQASEQEQGKRATAALQDRVLKNLKFLGMFFERAVDWNNHEFQNKASALHDKEFKQCADSLKDVVCDSLQQVLKKTTALRSPDGGTREYGEDTTFMALTMELYTSQWTLEREVVHISTTDILLLTNMLWRQLIQIGHGSADDGDHVIKLLRNIFPRNQEDNIQPWTVEGHSWMARKHGEWHNFTLRPRFLEFNSKDIHEPTSCNVSEAPIPRYLSAKADQRARRGYQGVQSLMNPDEQARMYGPALQDLKPPIKGQDGSRRILQELEELLRDLVGPTVSERSTLRYAVTGSSYIDLRTSLEAIQNAISQEVTFGHGMASSRTLLAKLQVGQEIAIALALGGIKGASVLTENSTRDAFDTLVKKRALHARYLNMVESNIQMVSAAKLRYIKEVRSAYDMLKTVAENTLRCEVDDELIAKAQSFSVTLAFTKAKQLKARERKANPTPAQNILDQLRSASNDGKETQEMRDLAGMPSQSFSLAQLVGKGVVMRLNEVISPVMRTQTRMSFHYNNEGYSVEIFMKNTLLKEFFISRQEIQLFEAGLKSATKPFADGLLDMNCFRLRRLLAWINAEGGL